MKKHLLILARVLVFILGASTVAANIALPPNNPTVEPPGAIFVRRTGKEDANSQRNSKRMRGKI